MHRCLEVFVLNGLLVMLDLVQDGQQHNEIRLRSVKPMPCLPSPLFVHGEERMENKTEIVSTAFFLSRFPMYNDLSHSESMNVTGS